MNEEKLLEEYLAKYENSAFDILNLSSDINYLYKLNAPFLITYEFCSGSNPDDYLNILTLSQHGSSYSQESIGLHNYIFHHKSPHCHDYYEFLIVLEGAVTQQVEGKDYLYPAGSCCLINRSLRHKEIFHQNARVLFLGFSVDFILKLLDSGNASFFEQEKQIQDSLLYRFIYDDINKPCQKAYLDFIPSYQNPASCNTLHRFAEDLILHMMFPKFGSTCMIKGLLCSILQYISSPENYHCTCMELSSHSDYLLFSRVAHLLEENNGRISRSELSGKLNYSGDYLNRIVNKYTGMCLHDYGMKFCMKKAAYYLSCTDEPISSIMFKLSFSNRTYFYKLFKEYYGMTPKQFRKERT